MFTFLGSLLAKAGFDTVKTFFGKNKIIIVAIITALVLAFITYQVHSKNKLEAQLESANTALSIQQSINKTLTDEAAKADQITKLNDTATVAQVNSDKKISNVTSVIISRKNTAVAKSTSSDEISSIQIDAITEAYNAATNQGVKQ